MMTYDLNSLTQWIQNYLAELIGETIETIDINLPLSSFDLDSIDAVMMAMKLEEAFGFSIHPETFLDGDASIRDSSERILQYLSSLS